MDDFSKSGPVCYHQASNGLKEGLTNSIITTGYGISSIREKPIKPGYQLQIGFSLLVIEYRMLFDIGTYFSLIKPVTRAKTI